MGSLDVVDGNIDDNADILLTRQTIVSKSLKTV